MYNYNMKINSGFLLQHFIKHLNQFPDLYVTKEEWSEKGFWYISLSDGEKYSISDDFWKQTQKLVPRLNMVTKLIQ